MIKNYDLFQVGCKPFPNCFCGFEIKSIYQSLLPIFGAPD
jgi:hypothetical protein